MSNPKNINRHHTVVFVTSGSPSSWISDTRFASVPGEGGGGRVGSITLATSAPALPSSELWLVT